MSSALASKDWLSTYVQSGNILLSADIKWFGLEICLGEPDKMSFSTVQAHQDSLNKEKD